MKQDNELPLSWTAVDFGDIFTLIRNGLTIKQNKDGIGLPISRIETISDCVINFSKVGYSEDKLSDGIIEQYTIQVNDILFSHINSPSHLGKTAIFLDRSKTLIHGMNLLLIRVDESIILPLIFHYLCSYYRSLGVFSGIAQNAVNQASINQKKLKSLTLNLPPLPEQHRIVTEIEKQFSRLDETVSALKRIKANLKRYKASVLKSAVEGKLTAAWREQHPALESAQQLLERILKERRAHWEAAELAKMQANGKPPKDNQWKLKYKEPVKPDITLLPQLPAGWVWAILITACEAVVDCHNKTAPYESSGIPLIRTSSIRDMKLNFDSSIRYVSKKTYKFWSKRCPPQSGDILFTREAPMGEAVIIPEGKLICMGQRIMLFRADKNFLSEKYLLYAVQNLFFKKIIDIVAVGTGVKHLRVGDVEKLPIPLPPLAEQTQIVAEVEKRLSVAEEVEQQINRNLKRAEHLRQAILKRAFSGKLVPQNPSDEPASELLEKLNQTTTKKP